MARIVQESASIQQPRFVREIRAAGALDDDFFERAAGGGIGVGIPVIIISIVAFGSGPVDAGHEGDDRGRHSSNRRPAKGCCCCVGWCFGWPRSKLTIFIYSNEDENRNFFLFSDGPSESM